MRPGEECSLQAGIGEVSFLEIRFVQRHFFHVGSDEFSLLQVRLAQISSREQDCCTSALFSCGLIPLFAGETTAHSCQRKGMQIYITQVCTAQVQPPAMLLLIALLASCLS